MVFILFLAGFATVSGFLFSGSFGTCFFHMALAFASLLLLVSYGPSFTCLALLASLMLYVPLVCKVFVSILTVSVSGVGSWWISTISSLLSISFDFSAVVSSFVVLGVVSFERAGADR